MATQAIHPPPQWRNQDLSHKKVVKSGKVAVLGANLQIRHVAVGSKVVVGPYVAVT
jgi:hypothetical protein